MNTKLIVSILVLVGGLLIASSAHAQVAISEEGVTFPDGIEQTAAVIVPMNCPHGDSIVWDSNAESWVCETDLSGPPYAISDTGPGGGIVFYITDGGLHGLEAALDDLSTGAPWGCAGRITGATGLAVFDGKTNTDKIVNDACSSVGDEAAERAAGYNGGGLTDWFLPSKDELNELYLQKDAVGGFTSDLYWSSSETSSISAWLQDFLDGGQGSSGDKTYPGKVRAVRAF